MLSRFLPPQSYDIPARPSLPVDCTEHHAGPALKCWCPSPEAEGHHNDQMERQQREAELRKAQAYIQKLQADIEELDVFQKERQLFYNRELEEIRRDTSEQVLTLNLRVARLQKEFNKIAKTQEKIAKEYDDQIRKLQRENEELVDAVVLAISLSN